MLSALAGTTTCESAFSSAAESGSGRVSLFMAKSVAERSPVVEEDFAEPEDGLGFSLETLSETGSFSEAMMAGCWALAPRVFQGAVEYLRFFWSASGI